MGGTPWLAVVRDLVLMGIGGAGLVREIFFVSSWDMTRVVLFLAMIAGSGILNATWLQRNGHTAGMPSSSPPPSLPPSLPPQ